MDNSTTFFSWDEYTHMTPEERGKSMAKMLSKFVNGSLDDEKRAFVREVMRDHRTLQQGIFDLFLQLCEQWAELKDASGAG